jgi:predicted phage tail protein
MPLTKIRLHGELADRHTPEIDADVDCVLDAVSAIEANYPGFRRSVAELHEQGTVFRVLVRKDSEEWELAEDQLYLPIGSESAIEITPIPAGSGAVGRIIAGVALIGLGATGIGLPFISASTTLLLGAALALGGVAALFNVPQTQEERGEQERSNILSGISNTDQRGAVTPIVYGVNVWAGSVFVVGRVRAQTIIFDDDDDSL